MWGASASVVAALAAAPRLRAPAKATRATALERSLKFILSLSLGLGGRGVRQGGRGDGVRNRQGFLDQAKHRRDHQEIGEVVERGDPRQPDEAVQVAVDQRDGLQ